MRVIAIDPGNKESAFCVMETDSLKPLEVGKVQNEQLRDYLLKKTLQTDRAAIEMVASYGMPVGEEVFDTVRWIGRYEELLIQKLLHPPALVKRMEEKMHICHTSRAKDTNIRHALIDRFADHDFKNGRGTKANPDFFYGFKADIWTAYAVGLTYIETRLNAGKLKE